MVRSRVLSLILKLAQRLFFKQIKNFSNSCFPGLLYRNKFRISRQLRQDFFRFISVGWKVINQALIEKEVVIMKHGVSLKLRLMRKNR